MTEHRRALLSAPRFGCSMSAINFLVALFLASAPQGCALSGSPAWSQDLRYLLPDCRIASPQGNVVFTTDGAGRIRVVRNSTELDQERRIMIEPPALFSWAPDGPGFFINEGRGSGMTSVFRFFRISDERIVEDSALRRRAVATFRTEHRCKSNQLGPKVWAFRLV